MRDRYSRKTSARGDHAGAIKAWETFARLFPPDTADVVTVKKWIAEAKAGLSSTSAVILKPPEGLGKLSKRSADNLVKGEAGRYVGFGLDENQ